MRPNQQLGNLHGVGSGTLAKIVADAPERQAVGAGEIFADPANEHGIVAAAIGRHGINSSRQVVDDFDAGRRGKQLMCFGRSDLLLGFNQNTFAVAILDRHTHTRGTYLNRVIAEDLAGLKDHLHFLARVAFVLERTDLGNQVERNRMGEDLVLVIFFFEERAAAGDQVFLTLDPCSACGLIGADHHAADRAGVVQRLHRQNHLSR